MRTTLVTATRMMATLLALSGCDRELSFGAIDRATDADAGGLGDAAAPQPFSCTQRGALLAVGDGSEAVCGAASRGFHHALCSCGNLTTDRTTTVDGFDSTRAGYLPGERSGALGVGGGLYPRTLTVGGSLTVAGAAGAPLGGDLTVGGNFANAGPLQNPYLVRVAGDARIAGDVRPARIEVAGTFTLAPGVAFETTGSTPERAIVDVGAPCRCDRGLDVAAIARAARDDNDNARERVDAARSLNVTGDRALTLPCGRYYVDDIFTTGRLALRISGRVALYVGQRIVVDPTGSLAITLDDGAEFDLFVADSIAANGPVELGAPRTPDRMRIYVGGNVSSGRGGNVFFGAPSVVAASLYAPHSELVASQLFTLYGAGLLASVVFNQGADLHFDRALATDACAEARCTRDDDCSAPLRCDGARCLP